MAWYLMVRAAKTYLVYGKEELDRGVFQFTPWERELLDEIDGPESWIKACIFQITRYLQGYMDPGLGAEAVTKDNLETHFVYVTPKVIETTVRNWQQGRFGGLEPHPQA